MSEFFASQNGSSPPYDKERAFELRAVRIVLEMFDLTDSEAELRHDHEKTWGPPGRLTFESFYKIFPSFPVVMKARRLFAVRTKLRPALLFRSFEEMFLMDVYLEALAGLRSKSEDRPFGLVVPFDYYRGGMIVHNGVFDTRGTRMIHDMTGDVPPHRVTVEPFIPFLRHLAAGGWMPSNPLEDVLPSQGPKVKTSYVVERWMNQTLGCGPAKDVFAFLWAVLCSASGYHRKFIKRVEGRRFVVIDQETLALETGLSINQIKRGIGGLREKKLITTTSRSYQGRVISHIFVDSDFLITRRTSL